MKQIALSLFEIASSGAYVWDQAGKGPAGDLIETADPAHAAEDHVLQPPAAPSPAAGHQSVQTELPASPPTTVVNETTIAITAPVRDQPAAAKPVVAEVPAPAVSQPQVSQAPAASTKRMPVRLVANAAPQPAAFAIKPVAYVPIPKPKPNHPQAPARVIKAGMKSSVASGAKPAAHGYADGTYTGPVTDAYYGLIQMQALIRGGRLTALKVLRYPSDRRTSIYINRQALPMLRDEAISAQSADVDIISGATLTSRAFIESLGGALKKASS
jgi:uncharacterized protein with FMN-binding domain